MKYDGVIVNYETVTDGDQWALKRTWLGIWSQFLRFDISMWCSDPSTHCWADKEIVDLQFRRRTV